jgi:hypothetical protein
MIDRSAVDTIRGYFYQFDYSILRVLQLSNPEDAIAIECIEDVDICTATEITAVQCKYYSGTEYNHSVIKPAVRFMLSHFKAIRDERKPVVKYLLCGNYKTGQEKLRLPIDVAFLKQHFLTYRERKVEHRHHEILDLNDEDLAEFLSLLNIDINAASFEHQFEQVIRELQSVYSCTRFTAEFFYYNNALSLMRELSIEPEQSKRTITKRTFMARTDTSSVLFNEWFVRKKGEKAHFAALRREFFAGLNLSPFERFFLVEVESTRFVRSDLKEVLHLLSKKWSKTTKRDGKSSFCPYVYVHGLPAGELVVLKKELAAEGFNFIDGYDFHGADFNVTSMTRPATHENGIQLKILNSISDLEATVGAVTKTRMIYQFHLGKSYFEHVNGAVKHVQIQLQKLTHLKSII